MSGLVAMYLLACGAVGVGLTGSTRLPLRFEERLAVAPPLGVLVVALWCWIASLAIGFGRTSVGLAVMLATLTSLHGWTLLGPDLRAEAADALDRVRRPWRDPQSLRPLLLLLAVAWPLSTRIFALAWASDGAGGIDAGHLSTWSDGAAHLAYAGRFVSGGEVPIDSPLAAGSRPATTCSPARSAPSSLLGTSLTSALAVASGFLALAFPRSSTCAGCACCAAGARPWPAWWCSAPVARSASPRSSATSATTASPCSGTFARLHPRPGEPALDGQPVAGVPPRPAQRAARAAARPGGADAGARGSGPSMPAGAHDRRRPGGPGADRQRLRVRRADGRRRGLGAARPPPTVVAVLRPGPGPRAAGGPLVAAAGLGGALAAGVDGRAGAGRLAGVLGAQPRAVPRPAAGGAPVARHRPRSVLRWFAPVWLLWLVPNLVAFHPWEWNNTKYFAFWQLLGRSSSGPCSPGCGGRASPVTARSGWPRSGCRWCCSARTGALDLARATQRSARIPWATADGVEVAEWIRDRTDADDVVVAAPSNTEPVIALSGRRMLSGFPGWTFDLGVPDWYQREQDALAVLRGGDAAREAVARRGVDLVVIGPLERAEPVLADGGWWEANAEVVHRQGEWTVYRVER
ncbi:MAG: hypothetical protein R2711_00940 [Acidimicrobiales bacterium]